MGAGVASGRGRNDPRRPFVRGYPLVAIGELAEEEREFLRKISGRLEVPLDLKEVEKRSAEYQAVVKESRSQRMISSARDAATVAGGKTRDTLGKVFSRRGAYRRDSNM